MTTLATDRLVGLRFADYVNPTTYHAFGVMLMASTTLRAFCQRLERYYAYINTADSVTLGEGGELYISQFLSPAYRDHPMEVMIHEAGWASTMVKMVRLVARPDYGPERVTMMIGRVLGRICRLLHSSLHNYLGIYRNSGPCQSPPADVFCRVRSASESWWGLGASACLEAPCPRVPSCADSTAAIVRQVALY